MYVQIDVRFLTKRYVRLPEISLSLVVVSPQTIEGSFPTMIGVGKVLFEQVRQRQHLSGRIHSD
jgi:hypothetical protein